MHAPAPEREIWNVRGFSGTIAGRPSVACGFLSADVAIPRSVNALDRFASRAFMCDPSRRYASRARSLLGIRDCDRVGVFPFG